MRTDRQTFVLYFSFIDFVKRRIKYFITRLGDCKISSLASGQRSHYDDKRAVLYSDLRRRTRSYLFHPVSVISYKSISKHIYIHIHAYFRSK